MRDAHKLHLPGSLPDMCGYHRAYARCWSEAPVSAGELCLPEPGVPAHMCAGWKLRGNGGLEPPSDRVAPIGNGAVTGSLIFSYRW